MLNHVLVSLINLISLSVGMIVLFFYLRIKRKKPHLLFILIVLSVLPLFSLLRPGSFESGDMTLNAYKTLSYLQSLQEGIFPPMWAGKLNGLYGYPLFLFTYPLPYFIGALLTLSGIPVIISMKVIMAVSFIASGVAMYYCMREKVTEKAAVVAAIFYLYTPYHLVDIHFRATLGELFAFIFLPLCFLFLFRMEKRQDYASLMLLSLSVTFLILSHQAISLIAIFLLGLYMLFSFSRKRWKLLFFQSLSIVTGLLLSAWYWLPVISEGRYTHQPLYAKKVEFATISDLLFSPYRFGFLFQGHYGELSHLIGYTQLGMVVFAMYLLTKGKLSKELKGLTIGILIVISLLVFFITPYSAELWAILPLIKNFQFSWRLLVFVCFLLSALAGIVSTRIRNTKILLLLVGLTISYTFLNWGNRGMIPTTQSYLLRTLPESSAKGEGLGPAIPKWTNPASPFTEIRWRTPLQVQSETGTVTVISHSTNRHTYAVSMKTDGELQENTLYFPGWEVSIDGKAVTIYPSSRTPQGVITFPVARGTHRIDVTFKDTPIRYIAKLISLTTVLLIGLTLLTRIFRQIPQGLIFPR